MDISRAISVVSMELGLELKDKQVEAIERFCEGSDVFVSLPTSLALPDPLRTGAYRL